MNTYEPVWVSLKLQEFQTPTICNTVSFDIIFVLFLPCLQEHILF